MNDETPEPFDTVGDGPLEARIVAWVLGEASAFEAAELERLCEERPELLVFRRRMLALHGLLNDAEASDKDQSWKLAPEKRARLDEIFGEEKVVRLDEEKEKSINHSGRRALLAIAACLVLTVIVMGVYSAGNASIQKAKRTKAMSSSGIGDPVAYREEQEGVLSALRGMIVDGTEANSDAKSRAVPPAPTTAPAAPAERDKAVVMSRAKKSKDGLAEARQRELLADGSKSDVSPSSPSLDAPAGVPFFAPAAAPVVPSARTAAFGASLPEKPKEGLADARRREQLAAGRKTAEPAAAVAGEPALQELADSSKMESAPQLPNTRWSGGFASGGAGAGLGGAAQAQPGGHANAGKTSEGEPTVAGTSLAASPRNGRQQPDAAADVKRESRAGTNLGHRFDESTYGLSSGDKAARNNIDAIPQGPKGEVGLEMKTLSDVPDAAVTGLASSNKPEGNVAESKTKMPTLAAKDTAADGDFVSPVNGTSVDGVPASPDEFMDNLTTNGLRSGDQAINRDNIDAILNNPNRRRASDFIKPGSEFGESMKLPSLADSDSEAASPAEPQSATATPPPAILAPTQSAVEGKPDADNSLADSSVPMRTNPALTKEHGKNVDEIRRRLYTAEGNVNLGKYDDAKREYEDAIRIDPNNSAARRGLERVEQLKSDYYRASYDHSRAELLAQVDAAWELPVPADKESTVEVTKGLKDGASEALAKRAKAMAAPPFPTTPPTLPSLGLNMEMPSNGDGAAAFDKPKAGSLAYSSKLAVPEMNMFNFTGGSSQPGTMGGMTHFFRPKDIPTGNQVWTDEDGNEADFRLPGTDLQPGFQPEYFFKSKNLKAEQPEKKPSLTELMEEVSASDDPYSTFSLNISDASFQLAKAALAKGERPDPESIKPEQFYNAVDYGDPAPTAAEPVAATIEQSAHPIIPGRNLVRVALRTASTGRSATQPLRLTLLVDQSGSMVREDRRAAMENALKQLGGLLTKDDLVTIVGFSRTPHLLADGLTGDQAGKLGEIINQTASEGGTNLEEAMKLGAQKAAEKQLAGAQNRIVLFTDGAANLGNANPDRLAKQVTELRQKGIAFDIAGIGADGLNDKLLGELARHGNGRYYVVGKEKNDSFAKQLAGAFRPAAENVKVQVNFNPQRVGKYKLIGFEKDRLKTEDFRNDSVDAAELAADEAGVAIYQVETLPQGTGEIGEVSVRFRDVARGEMVERTWTIPNEDSATAFDRSTPSMQLAGLSLLAAEKLKGGPMGDAIDFKLLAEPAAMVKQFYGASAPAAEMLQVIEKLK